MWLWIAVAGCTGAAEVPPEAAVASPAPEVKAAPAPAAAPVEAPPLRAERTTYDVWDHACAVCSRADASTLTVTASSERDLERAESYEAALAVDDTSGTAWCEGADGDGVGEWLDVQFAGPTHVGAIRVEPGFFASPRSARMLPRVAKMTIAANTGETIAVEFPDDHFDPHPEGADITGFDGFSAPVTSVRFTIDAVHGGGARLSHTCLSTVDLYVADPSDLD